MGNNIISDVKAIVKDLKTRIPESSVHELLQGMRRVKFHVRVRVGSSQKTKNSTFVGRELSRRSGPKENVSVSVFCPPFGPHVPLYRTPE